MSKIALQGTQSQWCVYPLGFANLCFPGILWIFVVMKSRNVTLTVCVCVWTFSKEVKLARYLPFYYVYFIAISSNMFIMDYQGYLHFCSCDLGFDFGFEFDQA